MKRLELHLIWIVSTKCGYSYSNLFSVCEAKNTKNGNLGQILHLKTINLACTHIMALRVTLARSNWPDSSQNIVNFQQEKDIPDKVN